MQRIIKHDSVRRVSTGATVTPTSSAPVEAAPPPSSPGVRVHRADGRVTAIEVTCECGSTTLVELSYEQEVER